MTAAADPVGPMIPTAPGGRLVSLSTKQPMPPSGYRLLIVEIIE